ncbi:MAG: HTH domain-containing protein [Pirellulales bacterium]
MASEFLTVARQVLEQSKRPMHPREIVSEAIRLGLFSDRRAGRTPHQTMKAKLSVNIRRLGHSSDFVRTQPGMFYLRHLLGTDDAEYSARPITKPVSTEHVLVFDKGWFPPRLRFQGIKKSWSRLYSKLLRQKVCQYLPRLDAEASNTYKQVLTYIMVTRRGSVLAYRRGNYNRVEDFLRGCYCVGFGGHVTSKDRNLFSSSDMGVTDAAIRELGEELRLPTADHRRLQRGDGLKVVGILNDDSSEVGERHIAILFSYEVSDDPKWNKPIRGEKSITQLHWMAPTQTPKPIWDFEYWSQLCLRNYFPDLFFASPTFHVRTKSVFQGNHLLCVLGAVGSGKSETTKVLRDDLGYFEINTGKIIARILDIPPVPDTPREVFQRRAWSFISSSDGPKVLARHIASQILTAESPRILIDGIRQRETLTALASLLPRWKIANLFVYTSPDLAYTFYKSRENRDIAFSHFLAIRNAEVERETPEMIGLAHAVLYNWKGRSTLRRTIKEMMQVVSRS